MQSPLTFRDFALIAFVLGVLWLVLGNPVLPGVVGTIIGIAAAARNRNR
jgi:hypothetical protein